MSRRRLRMTCESALRVAEWRLGQQQRRAPAAARWEPKAVQPVVPPRSSFAQLSVLWIVVGVLVLVAIELASRWAIDKRVEVDLGLLTVAFGSAAVIVAVVLALRSWRWKTHRGGR